MSWEFTAEFDAAHRAALDSGKPLVYVCPPAAWTTLPLFAHLGSPGPDELANLVLVPGPSEILEFAELLGTQEHLLPLYRCTGLARTARRLTAGSVRTLLATPADILELISRSQLAPGSIRHVVLVWPEWHLQLGAADALEAVLGECRACQRLLVTGDDTRVGDLLRRHAYRAPVKVVARPPEHPGPPVRYALASQDRLRWAVRSTLDVLNPATALLWDPTSLAADRWRDFEGDPLVRVAADPGDQAVDLALATELPTADALAQLREVSRQVVILTRPSQLPYLARLADPLSVIRLPSEVDRAKERAVELRRSVREHIDAALESSDLLALGPLFDEFDPALVAAAALRERPTTGSTTPPTTAAVAHWVRVRVDAGRRERIRTGDVVGALMNAVGMAKLDIGRIEVRESYTLVDIRAEAAERAVKGLDGLVLRGHRVTARLDQR